MSHFTPPFHHELDFNRRVALSRDRNAFTRVECCVAVREGERDIIDIEYRTLQLSGVANRIRKESKDALGGAAFVHC